jgi:putative toxin-antitoxin system antitoxin component (TIGR02293 family)
VSFVQTMISYLSHLENKELKKAATKQQIVLLLRKYPLRRSHLKTVVKKFGFNSKQAASLSGVALRTYQRQSPTTKLSSHTSENLVKLSEVYENGLRAFDGNADQFKAWLKGPVPFFGNGTPEDFLLSPMGTEVVNEELLRIEHGMFA